MNIELTKTQRLLLCGGLIGLASLMLQACETVMKENEDIREKICGNWQSVEGKPDILVYKEGATFGQGDAVPQGGRPPETEAGDLPAAKGGGR